MSATRTMINSYPTLAKPRKKQRHNNYLLNRFDKAAQAYAFVGGADPEDRPRIEKEYKQAKLALREALK